MMLYKPKAGHAPAGRTRMRLWPAIYSSIKDWVARIMLLLMIAAMFICSIMGAMQ